jgi:hypothetical protein
MKTSEMMEYARALYDAHGDKAEAEAARKAAQHEEAGQSEDAAKWRRIEAAIREMRGPSAS